MTRSHTLEERALEALCSRSSVRLHCRDYATDRNLEGIVGKLVSIHAGAEPLVRWVEVRPEGEDYDVTVLLVYGAVEYL